MSTSRSRLAEVVKLPFLGHVFVAVAAVVVVVADVAVAIASGWQPQLCAGLF